MQVEEVNIDWYIPGDQEMEVIKGILHRYFTPLIATFNRYW